jgi:hypothetical protein
VILLIDGQPTVECIGGPWDGDHAILPMLPDWPSGHYVLETWPRQPYPAVAWWIPREESDAGE